MIQNFRLFVKAEIAGQCSRKRSGLALGRPVNTTGASRRAEIFYCPLNTRKDAKFLEPEIEDRVSFVFLNQCGLSSFRVIRVFRRLKL
jgi:hypothetical protein